MKILVEQYKLIFDTFYGFRIAKKSPNSEKISKKLVKNTKTLSFLKKSFVKSLEMIFDRSLKSRELKSGIYHRLKMHK
jgi:hypothetical protein